MDKDLTVKEFEKKPLHSFETPYTASKKDISSHNVLLIDDEPLIVNALESTLSHEGFSIRTATRGAEALAILETEPISVIICDLNMPEMTGQEVLRCAHRIQPDAILIVLTAVSDLKTLAELINEIHISQFLLKPWDQPLLIQIVRDSIKRLELTLENRELHELTLKQNRRLEENHTNLQKELHIGGRVHQVLLLGTPPKDIPGISLEATSKPNKEIDGDFFGFYRPAPYLLDVIIADVMGKGLPAALVGTAVKTELTRFANPYCPSEQFNKSSGWSTPWLSPEEILELLHHQIVPPLIDLEYFVTLSYGRFDLCRQSLTYIDCGATKPFHYSAKKGSIVELKGNNFPLGVVEKDNYQSFEEPFEEGDLFLFYSDGVTEAHGKNNTLFGVERLKNIILKVGKHSPKEILDYIMDSLLQFTGDKGFDDDVTLMALKMGAPQSIPDWIKRKTGQFYSDLTYLSSVREMIHQFVMEISPGSKSSSHQLELAINEAFCNIVQHGYRGEENKPIKVTAIYEKGEIFIDMADQGESFRPSDIESPNFYGGQERGYGLFLIKKIADTVRYTPKQSHEGWNHLCLTKSLKRKEETMNLSHKHAQDVLMITLEGENLDAKEAPFFKQKVIDLIANTDSNSVVLDLHQLHFIDSSGLGSFLSLLRALKNKGGELKMAGMTDQIRTVFELVSMHKIFEIYNNADEAVRSFR